MKINTIDQDSTYRVVLSGENTEDDNLIITLLKNYVTENGYDLNVIKLESSNNDYNVTLNKDDKHKDATDALLAFVEELKTTNIKDLKTKYPKYLADQSKQTQANIKNETFKGNDISNSPKSKNVLNTAQANVKFTKNIETSAKKNISGYLKTKEYWENHFEKVPKTHQENVVLSIMAKLFTDNIKTKNPFGVNDITIESANSSSEGAPKRLSDITFVFIYRTDNEESQQEGNEKLTKIYNVINEEFAKLITKIMDGQYNEKKQQEVIQDLVKALKTKFKGHDIYIDDNYIHNSILNFINAKLKEQQGQKSVVKNAPLTKTFNETSQNTINKQGTNAEQEQKIPSINTPTQLSSIEGNKTEQKLSSTDVKHNINFVHDKDNTATKSSIFLIKYANEEQKNIINLMQCIFPTIQIRGEQPINEVDGFTLFESNDSIKEGEIYFNFKGTDQIEEKKIFLGNLYNTCNTIYQETLQIAEKEKLAPASIAKMLDENLEGKGYKKLERNTSIVANFIKNKTSPTANKPIKSETTLNATSQSPINKQDTMDSQSTAPSTLSGSQNSQKPKETANLSNLNTITEETELEGTDESQASKLKEENDTNATPSAANANTSAATPATGKVTMTLSNKPPVAPLHETTTLKKETQENPTSNATGNVLSNIFKRSKTSAVKGKTSEQPVEITTGKRDSTQNDLTKIKNALSSAEIKLKAATTSFNIAENNLNNSDAAGALSIDEVKKTINEAHEKAKMELANAQKEYNDALAKLKSVKEEDIKLPTPEESKGKDNSSLFSRLTKTSLGQNLFGKLPNSKKSPTNEEPKNESERARSSSFSSQDSITSITNSATSGSDISDTDSENQLPNRFMTGIGVGIVSGISTFKKALQSAYSLLPSFQANITIPNLQVSKETFFKNIKENVTKYNNNQFNITESPVNQAKPVGTTLRYEEKDNTLIVKEKTNDGVSLVETEKEVMTVSVDEKNNTASINHTGDFNLWIISLQSMILSGQNECSFKFNENHETLAKNFLDSYEHLYWAASKKFTPKEIADGKLEEFKEMLNNITFKFEDPETKQAISNAFNDPNNKYNNVKTLFGIGVDENKRSDVQKQNNTQITPPRASTNLSSGP